MVEQTVASHNHTFILRPNRSGGCYTPLPSVWGKTLIFRWLYPRKLVNLSESDGRAIHARIVQHRQSVKFALRRLEEQLTELERRIAWAEGKLSKPESVVTTDSDT